MLWAWNNLIIGGTWATTNASTPGYPVTNLASYLASDVWRSGTLSSTEAITATLNQTVAYNSALFPSYIFIKDHNFDTTVTGVVTVTVSLNGTGSFTFTFAPTAGVLQLSVPVQVSGTYNQVALSWTKVGSGATTQVGKVFIGPTYESGAQGTPVFGGYDDAYDQVVNQDYSLGHQKFSEAKAQFWSGHGSVPYVSESIRANLETMILTVGTFRPFWIILGNGDSTPRVGTPRYVTFSAVNKQSLVEYGVGYIWGMNFSFEEQL